MKKYTWFILLIIGVVLTMNAFLLPFQIMAFNASYYHNQFLELGVHERIGIDQSTLKAVTNALVDYIDDGSGDIEMQAIVNGEDLVFYNAKERHHLHDIYLLVRSGRTVWLLSNILMVFGLYVIIRKEKFNIRNSLMKFSPAFKISVSITVGLLLGLVALYFIDFDWAFRKFHEIFFTNDLWLLDPRTDRLIQLMPLKFFIDFTAHWLMSTGGIIILYSLLGFVLPRFNRKHLTQSGND